MAYLRLSLSMLGLVIGTFAVADVPVYTNEPSAEYMKRWLVCGPFPFEPGPGGGPDSFHWPGLSHDYLAEHGGEASPVISEGTTVVAAGSTAAWTAYESPRDVVGLDQAISPKDPALGYAYAEVHATENRACILAVGGNDDVRAWFNGELVVDDPGPGGLQMDGVKVPVVLLKGKNTLLVKVGDRGNLWELAARLLPIEAPYADQLDWFRVAKDDGITPTVRPAVPLNQAKALIESATLTAHPKNAPDQTLWTLEWKGDSPLTLPVDPTYYGEYVLTADVTFAGGVQQSSSFIFSAGEPEEHTLFADGASEYQIVVPREASDSERWAAQELQHWLEELSGAELPIVDAAQSGKAIVIGAYEPLRSLLPELTAPAPEDESFTYKNFGPTIAIWGGAMRGTMYGVMEFLEREMGVRFYTPRVTVTPAKPQYRFKFLYASDAPGIRVRNDFYHEAFDPIWAARNRVNGAMGYRDQPGDVEAYWSVHTFYPIMPPSEFFDAHPEYYSLIDGERTHDHAQLCLTNPDVLRIFTERIKNVMRENPQYLIYSVSQNDWRNPCQCDNCQAIATREESEAGPVIWFVNQIADAVKDEFPDKFIGTLAYQYTRKPCKTLKPRENVVIRLCSIECCFAHDFVSCPENAEFVDDARGWAAIAPHLYVWDYVVNFSHYVMPFPNFPVLQPNLQFFRDHNAIGIMEQAAYQSRGGEWAELRAYVLARLLWNPDHPDVESVIDDFMYGYYGRSGQYLREYFDLQHAQVTPETHVRIFDPPWFSDAFIQQSEALFDEAEKVADNLAILHRVEMARLPIMYVKCKAMPKVAIQDGTYDRFIAICEREEVRNLAEAGAPHFAAFRESMESLR